MQTTLKAGIAKVEITCREDLTLDAMLNEKSKKHLPPELLGRKLEVSDPLFVRALVLENGSETIVLLTLDVTAIGARTISQNILSDSADEFLPRLRERIEQEFKIPGGNVSACASHTHGVPRMLCDDDAQIERCLAAVAQALRSRMPVTLAVGSGKEDTLTFNRTMRMKDGTDYTLRSCNPPPQDEDVESLRPIDSEIGILRLDQMDGSPLAIVYNFGTHLLLGPPEGKPGRISADHVGVTLNYLEENIGGGVMAFFLQGAGGDAAEVSKCDTGHPRSSRTFGTRLGQSVLRGYRTLAPGSTKLRVVREHLHFPFRTDIPEAITNLKRKQAELLEGLRYTSLNFKAFLPLYLQQSLHADYPSHWAYRYLHAEACGDHSLRMMDARNKRAVTKYLDSMARMERMALNEENIATLERHQEIIADLGGTTIPAEIQGLRIGDCALIIAPMELLAETVLKLKKASPIQPTFVVSIANGYLHYAPPASYYSRGGYEVTECLLAPAWEAIFDAAVKRILAQLQTSLN